LVQNLGTLFGDGLHLFGLAQKHPERRVENHPKYLEPVRMEKRPKRPKRPEHPDRVRMENRPKRPKRGFP
jgi:hypothetical protein